MWQLIRHGETALDEPGRVALCRELASRLGVDYDELAQSRKLGLMSLPEVAALAELGVNIQLHTHRHCFPPEESEVRREIADNRRSARITPWAPVPTPLLSERGLPRSAMALA